MEWNEMKIEYYTLSCDRDGLYVVVVVEAIIRYSKINRSHFMINCSYKCSYSLYFNRLILRDTFVTTTNLEWLRNERKITIISNKNINKSSSTRLESRAWRRLKLVSTVFQMYELNENKEPTRNKQKNNTHTAPLGVEQLATITNRF